jgi:hypothetical protein
MEGQVSKLGRRLLVAIKTTDCTAPRKFDHSHYTKEVNAIFNLIFKFVKVVTSAMLACSSRMQFASKSFNVLWFYRRAI